MHYVGNYIQALHTTGNSCYMYIKGMSLSNFPQKARASEILMLYSY